MRGKLIAVFVACVLIGSALPLALGKKNKKDYAARLQALQKIYVDGSSIAVWYIRHHLLEESCLRDAQSKSEADAVLEVWETPSTCPPGTAGLCSDIAAKLLDPKTKEVLWYRGGNALPQVDAIHGMNGPYQWVLWNLRNSCCKHRPTPPPAEDSKP